MPKHRHRLFTRWFNRRIDLGAVLAGSIFILIWSLFPHDKGHPDPVAPVRGMFVQQTTASLSSLPAYLRPDLMLVPSRHSFRPSYDLPDLLSGIPVYRYTSHISNCIGTEPEGMGQRADLFTSLIRNYTSSTSMPTPRSKPTTSDLDLQRSRLYVKISDELHPARLHIASALLAALPRTNQHWHFSFWIAFDDETIEPPIFIEEHSGDEILDAALLDIVRMPDVWENAAGSGKVWLWYVPGTSTGTENEK